MTHAEKKQEVSKVNPTKYPAFLGIPTIGRGFDDDLEASDFIIPRAKLVQFTSVEAQAESNDDRVAPGKIINSITKEELSPVFIPVYRYLTFLCYNPLDKAHPNYDAAYEAGDLIFNTTDRNDPRVIEGINFGPNGEAPKVTKCYNYLSLFPGQTMPLVLSFKRTSARAARELNTMLQISGGDMFSNRYRLIVTKKEEPSRKYFTLEVKPSGKATEEEHKIAESIFNHFKQKPQDLAKTVEESVVKEDDTSDASWK